MSIIKTETLEEVAGIGQRFLGFDLMKEDQQS